MAFKLNGVTIPEYLGRIEVNGQSLIHLIVNGVLVWTRALFGWDAGTSTTTDGLTLTASGLTLTATTTLEWDGVGTIQTHKDTGAFSGGVTVIGMANSLGWFGLGGLGDSMTAGLQLVGDHGIRAFVYDIYDTHYMGAVIPYDPVTGLFGTIVSYAGNSDLYTGVFNGHIYIRGVSGGVQVGLAKQTDSGGTTITWGDTLYLRNDKNG